MQDKLQNYGGQFGEGNAYRRFAAMPKDEQANWLIKLSNHVADSCADAEESPNSQTGEPDIYKVAQAAKHASDLFILLCIHLGKDWDDESARFPYEKCDAIRAPYPGQEL
jgi:hypothetical protein